MAGFLTDLIKNYIGRPVASAFSEGTTKQPTQQQQQLQQTPVQPQQPDLSALLRQLQEGRRDPVAEYNRRSSLPSNAPGSLSPFATGFFGPGLAEQLTPEQLARSQGATATNQWRYPEMFPQGSAGVPPLPVGQNLQSGVTTFSPQPDSSSFMAGGGELFDQNGEVTGRQATNRFGYGQSSFQPFVGPLLPGQTDQMNQRNQPGSQPSRLRQLLRY